LRGDFALDLELCQILVQTGKLIEGRMSR